MPPDQSMQMIQDYTDQRRAAHQIHQQPPHPSSKKKLFAIVALVVILLAAGAGAYIFISVNKSSTSTSALAALFPAQVKISSTGFVPATVTVGVDQKITWTNDDTAPHTVASDPYPTDSTLADFNSRRDLTTNQHYSYAFNTAGIYTYHDDLNPYVLKGEVIVKK